MFHISLKPHAYLKEPGSSFRWWILPFFYQAKNYFITNTVDAEANLSCLAWGLVHQLLRMQHWDGAMRGCLLANSQEVLLIQLLDCPSKWWGPTQNNLPRHLIGCLLLLPESKNVWKVSRFCSFQEVTRKGFGSDTVSWIITFPKGPLKECLLW